MLREYLVDLLAPDTSAPMQYALDRRTFWFSHYLSTGLRTSSGILLIAILSIWLLPPLLALSTAFGAAALALVDLSGPWRSKVRELSASLLLNFMASLGVGLLAGHDLPQALFTMVVTFASGFLFLYGNRAMPVQFSMLLAMTLSMVHVEDRPDAIITSLSMGAGGLAYVVYTLAISRWQQHRLKQQVLSECLFALATYFHIKRGFYERGVDLDKQYTQLIKQQVVLAEKQQAARDLVLQREQDQDDARLIKIHLAMLDVYEQILTTHADYAALHEQFGHHEVLLFLRDLVEKATRDMESIAYTISRNQKTLTPVTYVAEQRAIEYDLQQLESQGIDTVILRSTYNRVLELVSRIGQLHAALQQPTDKLPALNMGLFISRPSLRLEMVRNNLHWQSPIFRFSLRMALAVGAAQLLVHLLPYSAHAYWIMLTIMIIMRPSYSLTRIRRQQRMVGTAIGCVLAFILLQIVREPIGWLLVLYFSLMVSSTFVQIRYTYTSAGATVTVIMLMQLTSQGNGTTMLLERLMDTGLGVALAAIFSYVLPNWERNALPNLLQRLLASANTYVRESRHILLVDQVDDQPYRLARQQFLAQIAGVNAALLRMLDEPRARQHDVRQFNQLLVRAYLMASHIAGLRMFLRRNPEWLHKPTYQQLLGHALNNAETLVQQAQRTLAGNANASAPLSCLPEGMTTTATDPEDTASAILRERVLALCDDAHELVALSQLARDNLYPR